MANTYVIGSGSDSTLEAGLADPVDPRGNEDHGNSIRVTHNGNRSYSFNGNTGQESNSGTTKHNAGEGVSIRSAGGSPKAFISSPEDVVEYQGMPVQAKVLEKMGVISLNSMGRYDFNEQATTPQSESKENSVDTDPHSTFAMTEAENQSINDLIPESVPQASLSAITSHGIQGAISGDLSSVIDSFSKSSGQSPEDAQATVTKVFESYSKASERYLAGTVGMAKADIPEFYSWAQTHAPSDLKAAVTQIVHNNSFKGLGKMVGAWAQANPPSEEVLKSAGYKTGKSNDGELTVHIPNFGEMSVKAAARSKLL